MTAENDRSPDRLATTRHSFNEAAADDRGKPVLIVDTNHPIVASMRPRPMTAENPVSDGGKHPILPASMRPRPMTAENGVGGAQTP